MAGQLMLSLSILIVLHEMGHFLPARLFGTRVEKFYLFFDPGFSLFKVKKGDTEYGIGWLPLGGYVKISGMIDESMDTEQMKEEPKEWEFRAKPAWQRLIIMLGGVTVNFILGFFLYAMVLWVWGEEYLPPENVSYGLYADSLGQEMGLQDGDQIIAIGDKPFEEFNDRIVVREIIINGVDQITVRRDGERQVLPIDEKFIDILSRHENKNEVLFRPRFPFDVAQVAEGMPADKAGLQQDDRLVALNGQATPFFNDFARLAQQNKKEEITVTAVRDQRDTLQFSMTTTDNGTIGVAAYPVTKYFDTERRDYTLAQALPAGTIKGSNFLVNQFKAFGQIFRGKMRVTESLGGFGSIASLYGSTWVWERFWEMTAILSLILAFMNLLPIPALDGGHVMFLLYEMVTGRKPSEKFQEYATYVGFFIVLSLIILANGLDIIRYIFN